MASGKWDDNIQKVFSEQIKTKLSDFKIDDILDCLN